MALVSMERTEDFDIRLKPIYRRMPNLFGNYITKKISYYLTAPSSKRKQKYWLREKEYVKSMRIVIKFGATILFCVSATLTNRNSELLCNFTIYLRWSQFVQ